MYDHLGQLLKKCIVFSALALVLFSASIASAQSVTLNILAVNGTDQSKDKDVLLNLPPELTQEDILDTDGLQLDYDASAGCYVVNGKITLNPKESRNFKVRVRDVWLIKEEEVQGIRQQIDESVKRLENTEYYDNAVKRKEALTKRLDMIVQEQEKYSDNVDKRVDAFRSYADDFQQVQSDSVSISYWKDALAQQKENRVLNFTVTISNPTTSAFTVTPPYYLPAEVKPEHLVSYEGFDLKFDATRGQLYLVREEKFEPNETKKFQIGLIDIWSIPEGDIDNLRTRANNAYSLLEKTIYEQTAIYLIKNIKTNLDALEASQKQEKEIKDYVASFRNNSKLYEQAKKDVEQLEDLLKELRKDLERSRLKNVLQKVKEIRSLADVAQAIFGAKPSRNNAWKIIIGIVIFVGIVTLLHFMIWGRRSREAKLKNITDAEQDKNKDQAKV